MTAQPSNDESLVFTLEEAYPDAATLFAAEPKPLDSIKDTALIVLDTNVLLIPYATGPKTVKDIRAVYEKLIHEARLFVPERVAREFARHRSKKLEELYQQLTRRKTSLPTVRSGRHPLLEPFSKYSDLLRVEGELEKKFSEYRELLDNVIDHVRSWSWNDPVSTLYRELFDPTLLIRHAESPEQVRTELARRVLHRIPPGYKDSGKADEGVGDLLIWLAVVELGRTKKTDLIFVTGEEKSDWWHRSEGHGLYPRFELMEEYWRAAGGKTLQITKFSTLLDLMGTSAAAVGEVRTQELEQSAPVSEVIRHRTQHSGETHRLGAELRAWARRTFRPIKIDYKPRRHPVLRLVDSDGDPISLDPLVVDRQRLAAWFRELMNLAMNGLRDVSAGDALFYAVVVVAPSVSRAQQVLAALKKRARMMPPIHVHVAVIEGRDIVDLEELRF